MTDLQIRRAVEKRMADGRERTIDDILCHVKVDPDRLRSVLMSMLKHEQLRSCSISTGQGDIRVYRAKEDA